MFPEIHEARKGSRETLHLPCLRVKRGPTGWEFETGCSPRTAWLYDEKGIDLENTFP